MNTKQIWIAIAVLAIALLAYFAYTTYVQAPASTQNNTGDYMQQNPSSVNSPQNVQENPPVTPPTVPATAGKINIDVVCQNALSYMSFPDASSSAAFVADCKLGNHPEVIEHYKAQMNVGDGAAI